MGALPAAAGGRHVVGAYPAGHADIIDLEPVRRASQRRKRRIGYGIADDVARRTIAEIQQVRRRHHAVAQGSGFFEDLDIRRHYVKNEYSAATYLDLLAIYSNHQTLPAEQQRALFAGIESLIKTQFSGKIIRETVALLYLARAINLA